MKYFGEETLHDDNFSKDISPEKAISLRQLEERFSRLEREYLISKEMLSSFRKDSILVPVSVFHDKRLSSLELVIRFLKDIHGLKNTEIAELLNRDPKTVWTSYNNSLKKSGKRPEVTFQDIDRENYVFPVSILKDRKFSALESIVSYLRGHYHLSVKEISRLMEREEKTIYTVRRRFEIKNAER